MFRTQLSAILAIIEGLLSVGLSDNGQTTAVVGVTAGVLSLGLGFMLARQSMRELNTPEV